MTCAIGFDLGGTFFKVGLFNGSELISFDKVPSGVENGPETFVSRLAQAGEHLIHKYQLDRESLAIGLGTPGIWDQKKNVVIGNSPNIPWLIGLPVAQRVREALGAPVVGMNDAKLQALAEAVYGAGRGRKVILFLGLGTGVGGAVVINEEIYLGANGLAGELGHISMDLRAGRVCRCDNKGCLEAYIGTKGIRRTALEETGAVLDPSKELRELIYRGSASEVVKGVFQLAKKGEKAAKNTVAQIGAQLGMGLANLLLAFDPEVVVIGGQISRDLDMLTPYVKDWLSQNLNQKSLADSLNIVQADFPADGGVIGAAHYALVKAPVSIKEVLARR